MSDDETPTDTQAQRRTGAEPRPEGAAISPRDTATGAVRATGGPMERAGTEAEARARGERNRGDRAG
ncbi:hypothetical protein [Methylobacterium symbioticum]|uniref:hypothetical protein n=1 Tax=uncultured Methylobacterium sp. TaxID=157278 RepID=UPI0025912EF0|nr:hypothetical protein [uncultured Methylobacterium sp.]